MKKTILGLFIFLSACGVVETPLAPASTPTETNTPTATAVPAITAEVAVPSPTSASEAEVVRISSIDGMPQVFIPAGILHMGGYDVRASPDEFPGHDVTLHAYWMDQLEVTNAMYALCVNAGICTLPQDIGTARIAKYFNEPEFNDYPVIFVAWVQAKTYCEWAQRRLPTEAEWERAARGDDMRTFPWGEDKPDWRFANFNMLVRDTSRVGSYAMGASPFGVLDMAGNVAEWTNDFYDFDYYLTSPLENPLGPDSSSSLNRVARGGSFGDAEINLRVSRRLPVTGSNLNVAPGSESYLGESSPRIGFRCVEDE